MNVLQPLKGSLIFSIGPGTLASWLLLSLALKREALTGRALRDYRVAFTISGTEVMATHKSAEKRARRTTRRLAINRSRRSRATTSLTKVESAITAKDYKAATEALRSAQSELARAAGKGVVSKERYARKISRLSARVKALKK
jgi:small subunit ribosomal protein S20